MGLFGPPNIEKLKNGRKIDKLSKALQHRDATIRKRAGEALGEIGDARAVDGLIDALRDQDTAVRKSAVRALKDIGDVRVETAH